MSTLSITTPRSSTPRVSPQRTTSDVGARFDALVRSAVPTQRGIRTGADFETAFDLDYGWTHVAPVAPIAPVVPVPVPRAIRRVRVLSPQRRLAVSGPTRLTRRGRVVILFALLVVTLAVMTAFGGWATASLSGGTPEPVRVVEVQPGDTLYGIAADLAKPGEIRTMVDRIQELNSLPGAQITEGQKLAVPRG